MEDENEKQEDVKSSIDMEVRKPGGLDPSDQGITGEDF